MEPTDTTTEIKQTYDALKKIVNATTTWEHLPDTIQQLIHDRYLMKNINGEATESIATMFLRVASCVSLFDDDHPEHIQQCKAYYDAMSTLLFCPNTPTFTGAHTKLGQLAACFVLPIDDSIGTKTDGIFPTLQRAALIQQTGGGVGFNFSKIRPRNDIVSTTNGHSSGPVSFLQVYNTAFGAIAQGGSRRGANMAVLRVDHPDIEEFIECKSKEGQLTNFNISVGLTDAFMNAVHNGTSYDLINPRNGEHVDSRSAREIYHKIATAVHKNGEPGVLYLDTAQKANPVPSLYTLEATNPCGEQFLGPYENCCLASINLARHVKIIQETTDVQSIQYTIDWVRLETTVHLVTRFLDDVITANNYVPSIPRLREAAHALRRIGLGIMGLADVLFLVGLRYGSIKSGEFAGLLMEFIRYHTMLESITLSRERGPFPAIKYSIYSPDNFLWEPPCLPHTLYSDRPPLDWDMIKTSIIRYGIRNGAQTTIAPTGTIATICQCEGYGCEPVFALAYTRTIKEESGTRQMNYCSPLFKTALHNSDLSQSTINSILERVQETGSCQDIKEVPENIRTVFVVSNDISAKEHITIQSVLQYYVDNSISKTINIRSDTTVEAIKQIYTSGWLFGCKGLTIYRNNSRSEVVLETNTQKRQDEQAIVDKYFIQCRPTSLHGITYHCPTPMGQAYITVNSTPDDEPFEMFITIGKGGTDISSISESFGRLISFILRLPSPLTPMERLEYVQKQLIGIGGAHQIGLGPKKRKSFPDALARTIQEFIDKKKIDTMNNVPDSFDLCPECGKTTLHACEGCYRCTSCGFCEC